ncbi:MAG TPA: biotin--[acetyl-CoA-carboxylase] ligase [Solirubrobacteraceae bacterium]|nr:biotin--[acetyl-CoA-carboxylase] ligase [Solirubrobacteraceae bacterium]
MLGTPRLHFRSTDSTNARARSLAGRGAPHGTLVTASEQTAGRGRQGRRWIAPPGRALLCSVLLREFDDLLPLAAGVAVAEVAGPTARLKWPNDVLLDDGKVAGILVESRPQDHWAVLGIGINVALRGDDLPEELRGSAATLGLEPGAVEEILSNLLAALERSLALGAGDVLEAFATRDALAGREIAWDGGHGRAAGIDRRGRLLVEQASGEPIALEAGEVHLAVNDDQSSTE